MEDKKINLILKAFEDYKTLTPDKKLELKELVYKRNPDLVKVLEAMDSLI